MSVSALCRYIYIYIYTIKYIYDKGGGDGGGRERFGKHARCDLEDHPPSGSRRDDEKKNPKNQSSIETNE